MSPKKYKIFSRHAVLKISLHSDTYLTAIVEEHESSSWNNKYITPAFPIFEDTGLNFKGHFVFSIFGGFCCLRASWKAHL